MSRTWHEVERVGFDGVVETAAGNQLYLILEKDFVCMEETVEDKSDNYQNPKAN